MQIIVIDDNGQRHEKILTNGKSGVEPDKAIYAIIELLSVIYPPYLIKYVFRNKIIPQLFEIKKTY